MGNIQNTPRRVNGEVSNDFDRIDMKYSVVGVESYVINVGTVVQKRFFGSKPGAGNSRR
jgi:hypothetical protein